MKTPPDWDPIAHIRTTLAERGRTQADLARVAKVCRFDLCRILKGKIDPQLSTVRKLLKALGDSETSNT